MGGVGGASRKSNPSIRSEGFTLASYPRVIFTPA